MMKYIFIALLVLSAQILSWSQSFSGIVSDEYNYPIQEVTITNLSKDEHSHTNHKGEFSLESITVGDSLLFSHISYINKIIKIDDLTSELSVQLVYNNISLEEIVVSPGINVQQIVSDLDIQTNPVSSSQDILRKIPGVIMGQHAGGGKAEQIFLRGFDIDHGTDINITVDGMPVNMVSHAHGQGYADLHFVIPETLEKIDFQKGAYTAEKGNFATAGHVDFITKDKINHSSIKLEAGQFDTYRMMAMLDLLDSEQQNAYIATEYLASDGPFDSPQNFNRLNVFGKYSINTSKYDKLSISASRFSSRWDASGQIPQRAIEAGTISRFGAIDDTEGGVTTRNNLNIEYDKIIDENSILKSSLMLSQYDFELYSNFTFFLDDPTNGDQIKQKEKRNIYQLKSEYQRSFYTNNIEANWITGISLRNDQSTNNELSRTVNRKTTLEQIQLGNIDETNAGIYSGATFRLGQWAINPSLRLDYFDFQYTDLLASQYNHLTKSEAILSPKFNIQYNPSTVLQLYFKSGKGFHSNDSRVVLNERANKTLPASYGMDVGALWKPASDLFINIAYWYLMLEQEFVYVGDAGIVEPSGKTKRQGLELSSRYQPYSWLYCNVDATYTIARATEEMEGENYIPLAPDFTLTGGLNIINDKGIYSGINLRHIANRPANEDNSIIAEGYTVFDLNLGYKNDKLNFGIQIQNLFDNEWNETQFATESRLKNEPEPVEEIHFTPGTPFFIKTMLGYNF